MPTSTAEAGSSQQRDVAQQPAATATAALSGMMSLDQEQQSACHMPASDLPAWHSPTDIGACQLQRAHTLHAADPTLLAQVHRQSSSTISSCSGPCWSESNDSNKLPSCMPLHPLLCDASAQEHMQPPGSSPAYTQHQDRQKCSEAVGNRSAAALRQRHQLHMIDLMLARVSAAEAAIKQGHGQCCQFPPEVNRQEPWGAAESCKVLLHDMNSDTPGNFVLPDPEPALNWGPHADSMSQQLPGIDDCDAETRDRTLDSDHMQEPDGLLAACTERAHSSSGSSIDCLGLFLVPDDWLTDSIDEIDLACCPPVPNSSCLLGLVLPLMPPSLLH